MKFEGIMPALVSPFHADETINTKALKDLMESLLNKGADGISAIPPLFFKYDEDDLL